VFNDIFNNISVISWQSVLMVEETGVPEENRRPVAGYWQTSSHNAVHIRTHNVSGDRLWLHMLVIYPTTMRSRPRRPNTSFDVDQKLKMATSHSPSLHCSFMGNSLSSFGEALKTMNAIKSGRYVISQIMHKWCSSVTNVYTDMTAKASIEISNNFSWT
jgi:hypothetical protein